ncbi:Ig-like domain-containing protein [Bacillus salipaludis]|uniref:Ig-like domain-containing protein n=1 Tax=Bacillus salipaludis TaxID=2547811 RepID=A0ABW8RD22_9BACI
MEFVEALSFYWNREEEEYDYDDFYNGAQDVSQISQFAFQFDQPINLIDISKIILTGPKGKTETEIEVEEDTLYLKVRQLLYDNSNYTLTIKREALTGSIGQKLTNDIIFTSRLIPIGNFIMENGTSMNQVQLIT